MSNIFGSLQVYAQKWEVVNSRDFSEEEINQVKSAEVVSSTYGSSVCFHMMSGGSTFIPLSNDSILTVGESVDLKNAKILTLHKDGEGNINRIKA